MRPGLFIGIPGEFSPVGIIIGIPSTSAVEDRAEFQNLRVSRVHRWLRGQNGGGRSAHQYEFLTIAAAVSIRWLSLKLTPNIRALAQGTVQHRSCGP